MEKIVVQKNSISIVIPAYNVENYIEQCLLSVIKQTYKTLEIIVVDDGSKDKTGEIADKYAKMDDRIIVVHQNNGGLPNARNTGMKYAHGEYVMFLDSDDWLEMTYCETAIREIQNENADIIFFEYYKEYRNKSLQMQTYKENKLIYSEEGEKEFFIYDMRTITAWGKIYRHEVVNDCQYNEKFRTAEDVDFNYRVYENVKKAVYIQEPLLHYRMLEKSAIHGYDSNIENKFMPVLESLSKWCRGKDSGKRTAYYSFAAIAFLLICQNGICLDNELKFFQKIRKIRDLKDNVYINDLYHHIDCIMIPWSRKLLIILGKLNCNALVVMVIGIKQWKEKRS